MPTTIDLKNRNQEQAQQRPQPHQTQPNEVFLWRAHEFPMRERSREWFWSIGIIGAGVSIFSLVVGNYLFALLVVLVIFLIFLYEIRGPREHEFGITPRGVIVEQRLFEFPYLESFWIFEHENDEKELSIVSHKTLVPHLKIPLGNADPHLVRSTLKQYIPEKHHEESLIDILARRFGF